MGCQEGNAFNLDGSSHVRREGGSAPGVARSSTHGAKRSLGLQGTKLLRHLSRDIIGMMPSGVTIRRNSESAYRTFDKVRSGVRSTNALTSPLRRLESDIDHFTGPLAGSRRPWGSRVARRVQMSQWWRALRRAMW